MLRKTVQWLCVILLMMVSSSCIDRDTIAGTGRETPDSMFGAGGNFQTGTIRSQLPIPLKVRVLSEAGRPVRGVVVEYSNPKGRVSFSDTTAITDGDGYASTFVTFGTVADSITVYATVLGLKGSPVAFSLLSRASTEARAEKYGGDGQSTVVTMTLGAPLQVIVFDPFNNPVRNVTAIFSTNNGLFVNPVVQTDTNGIASSFWTVDSLSGTKTAAVSFPTLPAIAIQFSAVASALNPSTMTAASAVVVRSLEGAQVPGGIQVKLQDKYGNPSSSRQVQFTATAGSPGITIANAVTGSNGIAHTPVSLSYGDSVASIRATSPAYGLPPIDFTFYQYVYLQIDSLRSSNGEVELFWGKNLNAEFVSYSVERCSTFTFDESTIIVGTITDESVNTIKDSTAVVGSSPYYRIKVNYLNNFSFYTNIRQITVAP